MAAAAGVKNGSKLTIFAGESSTTADSRDGKRAA
jgi:hypothetical protein